MNEKRYITVPLPRGYSRELVGLAGVVLAPWIERDDTHLELVLHRRGRVHWRIVQTSTGKPHRGFDPSGRRWGWRRLVRRGQR